MFSFMPDVNYKTTFCNDPKCELDKLCYFAHGNFELRSIYQSVPVVNVSIDYFESSKIRIQKYKDNLYFDTLEKNFVEKNPDFFL